MVMFSHGQAAPHGDLVSAAARYGEHAPAPPRIPEHLRPVLEQLLDGTTDDVASRRLNMSPRTFSRRVAELLDCLHVRSRFQAGVEAVQCGLLYHPGPNPGPQLRAMPDAAGNRPGPAAGLGAYRRGTVNPR
jgi:hypothetical protein